MAEKLFEDVDKLFERKPTWTTVTETIGVKIPGFLKKIEEKKVVDSPRLILAGVEFCIRVAPGKIDPEFIWVSLRNCSEENQTTSVTFLEESGARDWYRRHQRHQLMKKSWFNS